MSGLKKILTMVFSFILAVCGCCFVPAISNYGVQADADVSGIKEVIRKELETFIEKDVTGEKERLARTPGSKAEYNSSVYIHSELMTLTNFLPVESSSVKNGIERFEFISDEDELTYTSQNVVFARKSNVQTKKKVILSAHYDTSGFVRFKENSDGNVGTKIEANDGVNDNAASVALLLSLVKALDKLDTDPGYNIEVVFFGANNNNYAGSDYYVSSISEEQAKDILLVLNLDKVGVGKYNYFYVNEFENAQSEYYRQTLGKNYGFKNLNIRNVLHFDYRSPNGYKYSHIGLESDHAVFMPLGINTIHVFTGAYESVMTFGHSEYNSGVNITYTKNDNYDYIMANVPEFYDNLAAAYQGVYNLLFDKDFVTVMQKDNQAKDFYERWTDEKLAAFITIMLFIVFTFGFYLIFLYLNKRSRKRMKDFDIDKVVIRIAKNIGSEEEISDIVDKKVKDDVDKNEKE